MPGYIHDACKRFKHEAPGKEQRSPHEHVPFSFGAKQQYATQRKDAPAAMQEENIYVQQVLGTFLYYARAVDCTMLMPLSAIASEQASPTKKTLEKVKHFFGYSSS